MAQNIFPIQTPFASGTDDKTSIEQSSLDDAVVNWKNGFPKKFSMSAAAGGKFVSRKTLNYIIYYISSALNYIQKGGVALFNTAFTSDGGKYSQGSVIWYKSSSKNTWMLLEAIQDTTVQPTDSIVEAGTYWKPYEFFRYENGAATVDNAVKIKGNLTLDGATVATGCPTPQNPTDFANKEYVDKIANFSIQVVSSYPSRPTPGTIYFVLGE